MQVGGASTSTTAPERRASGGPARPATLQVIAAFLFVALVSSTPSHAQPAIPTPMEDYSRALECLTLAVAYEAGYESLEGQQAVAEVVLNRLRSSSFQKTVCDVVFAGSTRRTGCQFTFTCDGSLSRRLPQRVMLAARMVAEDALANRTPPRARGATHYHAAYVTPYWAPSLTRITQIGAHIFYHPPGKTVPDGPIARPGEAAPATSALRASTDPTTASAARAAFAPWGLTLAAFEAPRP